MKNAPLRNELDHITSHAFDLLHPIERCKTAPSPTDLF